MIMSGHKRVAAAAFMLALGTGAAVSQALTLSGAGNLVFNGTFDNPDDPLAGWRRTFDLPGESHYARNADYVSVVRDSFRMKNVLRIAVPPDLSKPGVKVFSRPIPYDPDARYRFSVRARGSGVMCRILVIGYRWNPRVTDRDEPRLENLRETYRFPVLHFDRDGTGGMAVTPQRWQQAVMQLPGRDLSDLARRHLNRVDFVSVQLMAIQNPGELFVDDVRLEKLP